MSRSRCIRDVALAFAVAGCGAPPAALPPTVTPPTTTRPPAPAPAPAPVVAVEPLASPGCVFGPGEGMLVHGLGFVVGGRRFATVDGRVTVDCLEIAGDARRAFAAVDTGAVRLAAEVDPASLHVAQRDASRLLFDWLDVRAGTIVAASQGRATLAVKLPDGFEAATPPVVELGCGELTPFRERPDEEMGLEQLRNGVHTALSTSPGGPVVGHLRAPAPFPPSEPGGVLGGVVLMDLFALETRGDMVRVRLTDSQAAVTGWIDGAALEDEPAGGVFGVLGALSGPKGDGVVCARDVALEVAVEGKRVRVGQLRAGASVPAERLDDGGLAVVLLDQLSALLRDTSADRAASEQTLTIAVEDASACQLVPE